MRAPPEPAPPAGQSVFSTAGPGEVDAGPVIFDWAGFSVRQVGTVVHDCLRRIAEDGLQRWNSERVRSEARPVRRALAAQGLRDDELEASAEIVLDALSSVLADPTGRWILSADHREAENELALSGIFDGQLSNVYIDRTFVDADGVRWIVDYKSGRHQGASAGAFLDQEQARYAPQLERYAALMANMERRPIRVGLYFPLLRGWRAWTPG